MRLFVAVLPEDAVVRRVAQIQTAFRKENIRGHYTEPENLHMTLAFIGEYHDPDTVLSAMSRISFSAFSVTMNHIGCFGDLWWAGFEESPKLDALAQRLRRALADAGIPFDKKRFKPHMTFLRKADRSVSLPKDAQPARMEVGGLSLMRSTRGKNGMIYTELGFISAK